MVGLCLSLLTVTNIEKKTVSSAICGTRLCTKMLTFEGSSPADRLSSATCLTSSDSLSGLSKLVVSAWTSAIIMKVSYSSCRAILLASEPT
jgi:hypothetical protein